ncbi:MAG: hypothetical protein EPN91_04055 [Salinibacterium sp.]|nr:MAG: hypothetical protein EPN91_04055 [Salinibacterium sp.]
MVDLLHPPDERGPTAIVVFAPADIPKLIAELQLAAAVAIKGGVPCVVVQVRPMAGTRGILERVGQVCAAGADVVGRTGAQLALTVQPDPPQGKGVNGG